MISKKEAYIKASSHFLNKPLPGNWQDYGMEGLLDYIDRHTSETCTVLSNKQLLTALELVADEYIEMSEK